MTPLAYLLWPLLGLLAFWASPQRHREPRLGWLAVYVLAGPFMLVYLAWEMLSSSQSAAAASGRGRGAGRESKPASDTRGRRRRGPRDRS